MTIEQRPNLRVVRPEEAGESQAETPQRNLDDGIFALLISSISTGAIQISGEAISMLMARQVKESAQATIKP